MSAFDKTMPKLALSLITKFGTTCILTVNTPGTYNTATGGIDGATSTAQTIMGAIEEYADNLRFLGDKAQASNTIVEGDKKITISSKGLTNVPKVDDKISVQGVNYNIQGVGSIWSGELVAVYVLHVRKN